MGKNLKTTLIAWPLIAALTIFTCFLTKVVAEYFGITLESQESVLDMKKLAGWNIKFFKALAMVLIVAPVVEEFIFRYLLWKLPDAKNFWAGVIPSSILFVAAHYIQMEWPNDAFAALFVFAVAQCWLYGKTQSIICPMLNHALFNLTNIILLFAAE